jgi:hypothetical protein
VILVGNLAGAIGAIGALIASHVMIVSDLDGVVSVLGLTHVVIVNGIGRGALDVVLALQKQRIGARGFVISVYAVFLDVICRSVLSTICVVLIPVQFAGCISMQRVKLVTTTGVNSMIIITWDFQGDVLSR